MERIPLIMRSEKMDDPIIVIGMHRSGTSMLSKILQALGAQMGWKRENNEEATFFNETNIWLMKEAGSSWDNPAPMDWLLDNNEFIEDLIVPYLYQRFKGVNSIQYWGVRGYLLGLNPNDVWGWKDPRNTYTLPIWLKIFPKAKIVNVIRHGVDVSVSLTTRARRQEALERMRFERLRHLYLIRRKRGAFLYGHRCFSLPGSMGLWLEYCRRAKASLQQIDRPSLTIRYENLVKEPESVIESIQEFMGANYDEGKISKAAGLVMGDRVFKYRENEEYREFSSKWADELKEFGYEP